MLVRYTMNAVFRLDRAGVVIRMAAGPDGVARTQHVVRVATALAALDAPTVQLAPGIEQPVSIPDWSATVWTLVPQWADEHFDPVDLAGPLQHLHAVADLGIDLPRWNLVAKIRRRLARAADLDHAAAEYMDTWAHRLDLRYPDLLDRLAGWCDDIEQSLARMPWALPLGPIHADAHTGNLLRTPERIIICDLDSVTWGPREWDLTPAAHGVVRFGRDPLAYQRLADAYGFDLIRWCGWDSLCQARELQLVTSVIADLPGRPDVADELVHRLRSVLTDDRAAIWHRYR